MALVIVLTFFVLLANAEKRILLTDPDVIHAQLHTLEQKMEDVMAWKADITVKFNTLQTITNGMQIYPELDKLHEFINHDAIEWFLRNLQLSIYV